MNWTIEKSFLQLKSFCEKENYKGWDPYDGLTSKVFQTLPFISKNRIARLAWIQFYKRSPLNFRPISLIPKEYNAKGLALFLTAYCNLYRINPDQETLERINLLAEKLISLQNKSYAGSSWGYYFDWQARAFFQPANTPTAVATSFASDALLNAYDITNNTHYLTTAISSADFILKDLNRTHDSEGDFCFSYSPLDNTQVFNASLLSARLLSRVYYYTKNDFLKEEAQKAIAFTSKKQQTNGAWSYGTLSFHQWIDNFHTGFNLECIYEYEKYTGDKSFSDGIQKGFHYYINTFFGEDGSAKYYNNQLYPIDIHSPAQLIVTLSKLNRFNQYKDLAEKVLLWTIKNMQDKDGYFYYQKRKWISSKIPYMRWAQAWMFYAMSYYLLNTNKLNEQPHSVTGNTCR
jgi:rhamnogalacturonyl hydrolase YesR